MNLFLAKVEETTTPDDFRMTVRILPEMKLLPKEELPRFPFFFSNRGETGKIGDLVWIVSNAEFSLGFVLGKVSKIDWTNDYSSQSFSKESFENIRNVYVEFKGVIIPYTNLSIIYWDNNCIHAVDGRDGSFYIGYSSGTINVIKKDEVLFMTEGSSEPNVFHMEHDNVSIKAQKIYLNAESIYLGRKYYGNVVVTQSNDAEIVVSSPGVFA